jgi:hypothetical protein
MAEETSFLKMTENAAGLALNSTEQKGCFFLPFP